MGWWKDANEAEDPDKLVQELKGCARGARDIARALKDEVKRERNEKRDRR